MCGHDFSRQHLGKLSFYDTMRMIIGMGKGSTSDEIMKEQGDVYHYMNTYKTIPHFQKLLAGRHLHYL